MSFKVELEKKAFNALLKVKIRNKFVRDKTGKVVLLSDAVQILENAEKKAVVAERKRAVEFGHWLVNSPSKEKFKIEWIEEKHKQFEREFAEGKQ